jgi:hypothetical protein
MKLRASALSIAVLVAALPAQATDPGGTFIDDDRSVHESAIEAISAAGITEGCDPVGDRFCPGLGVTRAEMSAFLVRSLGEASLTPPVPTFSDVIPSDWFFGAVERLSALGISVGYGDGTFRPNALVTRGEMAVFLVRALGEDPTGPVNGAFADVDPTVFYASAAERLLDLGITTGCATSPLRYCPEGAVVRAEMASFLARAFDLALVPVVPRPSVDGVNLSLQTVVSGLSQPVFVDAPAGDERLFVAEKSGRIRVVVDGVVRDAPFLDLSAAVSTSGERGLLGMAFHPGYLSTGRFYVHYTDLNGANRIVEYTVSAEPDLADPSSARVLFTVPQPASNHNGGMIDFGPDGRLYVGIGDGGGSGDPFRNGQDPTTPLGTITAIDLESGARTLFAFGLRNPWRFSWDSQRIYIGDVGQNAREEIDVLSVFDAGSNLGWSLMEGSRCYVAGCSAAGLVLPVAEYGHVEGCSVTGGLVYRGTAIPELSGQYFYGDFCSGFVRSFRYTGAASEGRSWPTLSTRSLVSFGTDGAGEMYVVSIGGTVSKVVRG